MPREGHDPTTIIRTKGSFKISIHVPREGHDVWRRTTLDVETSFQSTCPARGTTLDNINLSITQAISIHVPREGHDEL